jgi:hypothetical protein
MRLYTDLDDVLVHPVLGGPMDDVVGIIPRPGVDRFIRDLSRHGDVWLLTASMRGHAERALRTIASAARLLAGVITREDLAPVEEQILVVETAVVDEATRRELWSLIEPVAPPGFVFDDYPVGSGMFILKATAVGIGPESWIRVEPFLGKSGPDDGLRRAYMEFRRRAGPSVRIGLVHA